MGDYLTPTPRTELMMPKVPEPEPDATPRINRVEKPRRLRFLNPALHTHEIVCFVVALIALLALATVAVLLTPPPPQ